MNFSQREYALESWQRGLAQRVDALRGQRGPYLSAECYLHLAQKPAFRRGNAPDYRAKTQGFNGIPVALEMSVDL